MTVPPLATIRRVLAAHWHANWEHTATVEAVGNEADRALYAAFGLTERPAPPRTSRPKRTKRSKRTQ